MMGSLSINFLLEPTLGGGFGILNNVGFASRRSLLLDVLAREHTFLKMYRAQFANLVQVFGRFL